MNMRIKAARTWPGPSLGPGQGLLWAGPRPGPGPSLGPGPGLAQSWLYAHMHKLLLDFCVYA
jgi:hypothetical protein